MFSGDGGLGVYSGREKRAKAVSETAAGNAGCLKLANTTEILHSLYFGSSSEEKNTCHTEPVQFPQKYSLLKHYPQILSWPTLRLLF